MKLINRTRITQQFSLAAQQLSDSRTAIKQLSELYKMHQEAAQTFIRALAIIDDELSHAKNDPKYTPNKIRVEQATSPVKKIAAQLKDKLKISEQKALEKLLDNLEPKVGILEKENRRVMQLTEDLTTSSVGFQSGFKGSSQQGCYCGCFFKRRTARKITEDSSLINAPANTRKCTIL